MTNVAERRAFLIAYEKSGSLDGATARTGTALETHKAWLADPYYMAAYCAITQDLKRPPKPKPQKKLPVAKKRGRPPKKPPEPEPPPPPEPKPKPATEPQPAPKVPIEEPPSVVVEGKRGYTRLYVREGQEIAPAEEPEPPPKKPPADPEWVATSEVTVASDEAQRQMIDEYGELDRRMKLYAMDVQRYDTLKHAIKSWFDQAPADADGTCEGNTYLLHLSARERERRIRDMHELVEVIGIDKFLEIASVAIGVLENLLGKDRVRPLIAEARTGSRRIKAIAKRAVSA